MLDGELRRVPSLSTVGTGGWALPFYIVKDTDVNTSKQFADAVSRNLIVEKTAKWADALPGGYTGQYIQVNSTADLRRRISMDVDTGWIAMSGEPAGVAYTNAQYRKIGKQVFLRGTITVSSVATLGANALQVLPAGLRPATNSWFAITRENYIDGVDFDPHATVPYSPATIQIETDGEIRITGAGALAGSDAYVFKLGGSFFTD
jgi:hypothetical protein